MKYLKFAILLIVTAILFSACGSKYQDECGCNGIIYDTIHWSDQLVVDLYYKVQLDTFDKYYNNMYWLFYVPSEGFTVHYIICNEGILPRKLKERVKSGETVKVQVAGYVTQPCETPIDIPERIYDLIILTKIKEK